MDTETALQRGQVIIYALAIFQQDRTREGADVDYRCHRLESWTDSRKAAARYARADTTGKGSVVLEIEGAPADGFKDISEMVRALVKAGLVDKETAPPVTTESEWFFLRGRRLIVKKVLRNRAGQVRVILEPQPLPARS
ncbi:MAG: hypothetical protein KDN18_13175 [Verrucomicrobiae bacterium]|nr:hypothetical protein [Verrucomicrobiae bacterium]